MAVNPQQTNVPFSIVGIYEIQAASTHELNHMHFFPRKNFIIKRGGIPKFKSVFGTEAEVTDVKYDAGGVPVVTLKPVNSRKLFRINPTGDTTICRRPWNLGN